MTRPLQGVDSPSGVSETPGVIGRPTTSLVLFYHFLPRVPYVSTPRLPTTKGRDVSGLLTQRVWVMAVPYTFCRIHLLDPWID